MKRSILSILLVLLGILLWARGSVDAEAEALDIDSLTNGKYMWFSEESFNRHSDKNRVLFFHAAWCPTCRKAQKELIEEFSTIPSDAVVFKIDYDNNPDLKNKYGITRQHTFVIVDSSGKVLITWNGGDTEKVVEELAKL